MYSKIYKPLNSQNIRQKRAELLKKRQTNLVNNGVKFERNLTFKERFNRANTRLFRFIGLFSLPLLVFLTFNFLNIQQTARATNAQAAVVNSYLEITPAKKEAVLTSKTVEKTVTILETKSVLKVEKYTVKNGDTLFEICKNLNVRCAELIQRNKLEAPYSLKIGQELDYIK